VRGDRVLEINSFVDKHENRRYWQINCTEVR